MTNDVAKAICEALQAGNLSNKQIALLYNTTESVVSDIKQGHGWKFISRDYIFYQRPRKLLTDNTIESLCKYFQSNIRDCRIKDYCINALKHIGIEPNDRLIDSVRKIYTHKYYTNISNKYKF